MKQKTRILIYILISVTFVILGSIAIVTNHQADIPASAEEHIDLGRIYLTELSWEKAVLEFTEAIEIEPLNADAYLGLAEAYAGMGDIEKAIEVLEEGYDKTGDERLKNMLEELLPPEPEETTVTTVVTTEEVTTASTVAMVTVPDLSGLTEEEAIAACEAAGLQYSVSYDYSDVVEKGYVIGQTIPVDASVVEGISVPFTVSEGAKVVTTAATTTIVTTNETTTITTTTPVTNTIKTTTTAHAEEFIMIKGKKYATSLTELNLYGMDLTNEDIKDLHKMKNLEILILSHNDISDISTLKNLTNLTKLYLYYNKISDINALKNLTNLTELQLNGNQIDDISALENLTTLTQLYFYDNKISDISALKSLTNLTYLDLSKNQISDISALKSLTNLTGLDLSNNKIRDISALKSLTNLTGLDLSNNKISDISALKSLTNLFSLELQNSKIGKEDIKELEKALPNCEIWS